jgi:hypothetical protein
VRDELRVLLLAGRRRAVVADFVRRPVALRARELFALLAFAAFCACS